jgi:hypothetical protein
MPYVSRTGTSKGVIAGAFVAVLALGACAQSADTIAPVPVEEARYEGFTCAEMGDEMRRVNRGVALLSAEQSTKQVNDAVGWFHLLGPAGSATRRDIRSWIAFGKGEMEAIERVMGRRC